mmetsp:Transcript_38268/g.114576  ORF Transcript_38268/g.114576 Transcript_38268/m.114576 type:complete len:102 (+) Transcript_38268:1194-1499(+)
MCHRCQKKGHYSYKCPAPAPVPQDVGAMLQLNVEADDDSADGSGGVPGFQFLNLKEVHDGYNPDAGIESILFAQGRVANHYRMNLSVTSPPSYHQQTHHPP